jgi:hypothetical protein
MYAYTTMQLVMQAYLFIQDIIITGHLYAVHAQVGIHNAGLVGILGIYLRHGNKRAAIIGPVNYLRQFAVFGFCQNLWANFCLFS